MYLTEQAEESAARALIAIGEHWQGPTAGSDLERAKQVFEGQLPEIANRYWADRDYDRRATHADIKADIKPLVRPLEQALGLLTSLPRQSALALNREIQNGRMFGSTPAPEAVAVLIAASNNMLSAAVRLSRRTHKRTGHLTSVSNACRSLMELWDKAFGRAFSAGTVIHNGEFTAPDAQLLLVALKAIDPDIRQVEIRTSIRAVKAASKT